MTFTITADELDATNLTSSGAAHDVLAVAAGLDESNDRETFEVTDYAVEYVLDNYDWEAAYIAHLNATQGHPLPGGVGKNVFTAWQKSFLLFGAFMALEHPDHFAVDLKDWKDEIKAVITSCPFDLSPTLPADLAKQVEAAYTQAQDDDYNEWLHGDHHNWPGLFAYAGKKLFNDRDVFSAGPDNSVMVTVTDYLMEQYHQDNDQGDGPDERADEIDSLISIWMDEKIKAAAGAAIEKRRRKSAEQECVCTYQAKLKADKEAARRAKLLTMKKK